MIKKEKTVSFLERHNERKWGSENKLGGEGRKNKQEKAARGRSNDPSAI